LNESAGSPRQIRSYVLRQGRTSDAQRRAVDDLTPRFGVAYAPGLIDFDALFGRRAPRILEIGFGMGDSTVAIARAQPDNDYLAIEVHTPGVGNLLKLLDAGGIGNVRVIQHDAVEVLRDMIAPDSLDGFHLFFPDPWPKKRHHKRRLVQPAFVAAIVARLKPGGYFHMATDWEDYALHALEVLRAEPGLINSAADFAPRPAYRPVTKFERRGVNLGHGVWDLVFLKRG